MAPAKAGVGGPAVAGPSLLQPSYFAIAADACGGQGIAER